MQNPILHSIYRLWDSLGREGIDTTFQKVFYRIKNRKFLVKEKFFQGENRHPDRVYELWRKQNDLTPAQILAMKSRATAFAYKPKIGIVIPCYKPDIPFFIRAIESVQTQIYTGWELCLCDDGSNQPEFEELLQNLARKDSRILVRIEKKNGGIISASQKAAELSRSEFIAFMDQDDLLTPDALFRVAEKLNEDRTLDLIYSDNDKVDLSEKRCEVYFKPDFSADEFFCHNYIGHLSVLRQSIFDDIGGFIPGFEGAQDFEILLRALEKTSKIAHLPYILYSWRKTPGSTASSPTAKRYAYESGKRALENFFQRKGQSVRVEETDEQGLYRCRFEIKGTPLVSIVLSSPGLSEEAVRSKSSYQNIEVISPATESSKAKTFNEGALKAKGEYVILIDGNMVIAQKDWIESLLEPVQRQGVGIVGAKILDGAGIILEGGKVFGLQGLAGSAFRGVPDDAVIYNQPHRLIRNTSAVSWDAMLVPRTLFTELGGFEEDMGEYADVDFCLRAGQKGAGIVWTPFAVIRSKNGNAHAAQFSGGADAKTFHGRWKSVLEKPDPFYNVNLSLKYTDFSPNVGE